MSFNGICWGLLLLLPGLQCLKSRYVVDTDYCRIPDPSPYDAEVMKNFQRGEFKVCTNLQPLTWVEYNESSQHYILNINETAYQWYVEIDLELRVPTIATLKCCYMKVQRATENQVELGKCREFRSSIELPNDSDSFIVECSAKGKLIYTNAHSTVPERSDLRERLLQWKDAAAPSVLMIGIDSISRLNLIRAMPKTYYYLQFQQWFEMSGYNKIADNTLPNLLALLTGLKRSSITEQCNPHQLAGLDRCPFIWQRFRELGYVTAFGEDDVAINTFNYKLQGFLKSPVDYYLRPHLIAAEQFLELRKQEDQICLGYEHSSHHVYNYALEFARRYRNDSFFGFFWTNTHSHGARISRTTAMDEYMAEYLERLVQQGTMDNTIVMLLSDHGLRQGPTRRSKLGWLEERLPFLFIWLPLNFKLKHPEFVEALTLNKNQLTNPFDLHATLQHILNISERRNQSKSLAIPDCINCHSLLLPISANRSCAAVNIPAHWCTCWSYLAQNTNNILVQQLAQFAFQHISNLFGKRQLKPQFQHLQPRSLANISSSLIALPNKADDPLVSMHRLQLVTLPRNVVFEVTVCYNQSSKEMSVSDVSRFDAT